MTTVAILAAGSGAPSPASARDATRPLALDEAPDAPGLTHPKALMLATRAGDVLVGVEATAGRVRVAVIPPDVRRLRAGSIRALLRSGGRVRRIGGSCGWNCLQLDGAEALRGRPTRIHVSVTQPGGSVRGTLALPARMPAAGSALYARAQRFMNRLRTLRVRQVLASGVSTLRSTWLYQAPDRSSYVASNGTRGVVIGHRRWDYVGGRWTERVATHSHSPHYMWAGAARPRIVGTASRRGRRVQVLALFKPNGSYPAFFKLYVERTGRVVEAQMLAPAHFMLDKLDRFNASIRIRPPT